MKKNILYLAGALLSSAILTSACSEDIPTYSELTVDKTEVFIQADGDDPAASIRITGGNGNYKVSVADESVATATVEGTTVTFNGLKNGVTTATISDWSQHSAVVTIKVKEDFDLKLDMEEGEPIILVKEDDTPPTREIGILSGNGGYTVTSSDENIASAVLTEENKILLTGLNVGFATVTVTDNDGKQATASVTVCEGLLVLEDISGKIWKTGETSSIQILSGNGEYSVSNNTNPEVATAEIEGDAVTVTGVAKGETTLTITDRMGFEATVTVAVRTGLKLEKTEIDLLIIGEQVEISILDGSKDYAIACSESVTCTLSDDKNRLLINGRDGYPALNQTVTITDNIFGEETTIALKEVNYEYETFGKSRWYIEETIGIPAGSRFEQQQDGRWRLVSGTKTSSSWGTTKISDGYVIYFKGDLTVGKKEAPELYHLNSSGKEEAPVAITDLEITKTENVTGEGSGKYWIRFTEDGKEKKSYIVVWT